MTKQKVVDILAVIGGLFTSVMYISYLIKLIGVPEGALANVITYTVLALAVVPLVFHRFFKRILGKAYNVLKIIYTVLTCFYMISFIAMSLYLLNFAKMQPPASELTENDAIIVFGCRAYEYGPGETLRRRLDKTVEIMQQADKTICVVSGGQGIDEPIAEADAMDAYLVKNGISHNRILIEDKAGNTKENIDYSVALLEANNINPIKVACVSSRFHLARISLMCHKEGINAVYYPSDDDASKLVSMLVREYMSVVHYFMFGY